MVESDVKHQTIYQSSRKGMRVFLFISGHLLFEMCLGLELTTTVPQPADLSKCESKSPDIVEV